MDWVVGIVVLYLVLMFGIAWYFSRKESLEGYFLNKKSTGLWMLSTSNVSTMLGAGGAVAVVAEVYNSGISYGLALPSSLIFGSLFLAIIAKKIKSVAVEYDAYTIPDFFEKRFDKKNKVLMGIVQICILLFWVAIQAVAISTLASILVEVNYMVALMIAGIFTIAYTALGGLKIDIISDFVQFWIILIFFVIVFFYGYGEVGGFSNLISNIPEGHLDPFAFGGVVWFLGSVLLGGLLYLGGSHNWQRVASSQDKNVARNSFYISMIFFFVLGFIILFLGLFSSVLVNVDDKEYALFELIIKILPDPLIGFGFAAILAVVMSSVDSNLVGSSTIIYRSFVKRFDSSGKNGKILHARLITAVLGIIGFSIAYLIPDIVVLSLFVSYLAVMVSLTLLFGLFSKKLSANASFYSIISSVLLLILFFPIMGPNSFIPPLIVSLGILVFYDRIFMKR